MSGRTSEEELVRCKYRIEELEQETQALYVERIRLRKKCGEKDEWLPPPPNKDWDKVTTLKYILESSADCIHNNVRDENLFDITDKMRDCSEAMDDVEHLRINIIFYCGSITAVANRIGQPIKQRLVGIVMYMLKAIHHKHMIDQYQLEEFAVEV